MAEIYIGVNNWEDVNWYLQEGYFIADPSGIQFPGYFTLQFDLLQKNQCDALRVLVMHAREKGIRITSNDEKAILKIGLPLVESEDGNVNVCLLSNGKVRQKPEKTEEEDGLSADRKKQLEKCNVFFLKVAEKLTATHRIIGSALKTWGSACLIPKGTENQMTYYGKPVNSLRVACNWNWRASLKRCNKEDFVQCVTPDLPWPMKRPADNPTGASRPIWGNMVGYFDEDNRYHCVYGEKFDRRSKTWTWVEGDVDEVVQKMREASEREALRVAEPGMDESFIEDSLNAEVNLDEI